MVALAPLTQHVLLDAECCSAAVIWTVTMSKQYWMVPDWRLAPPKGSRQIVVTVAEARLWSSSAVEGQCAKSNCVARTALGLQWAVPPSQVSAIGEPQWSSASHCDGWEWELRLGSTSPPDRWK